jgi:hypothetical protein
MEDRRLRPIMKKAILHPQPKVLPLPPRLRYFPFEFSAGSAILIVVPCSSALVAQMLPP